MASGALAMLIPPSALAVIFAVIAKVSIGKVLIALIAPGLLLAVIYALYIIGRADSEDAERKLLRAGANRVVSPYQIGARQLAQTALRPAAHLTCVNATRAQIDATSALYARMRSERAAGRSTNSLRDGYLRRRGLLGLRGRPYRLPVERRLFFQREAIDRFPPAREPHLEPKAVRDGQKPMHPMRRVLLRVRMLVMLAMVISPPERPALDGGGTQHREEELHRPRGLETPMRKVAVVKPRDGEHPHPVEDHRHRHCRPTPADPEDPEASRVQQQERRAAPEVHLVRLGPGDGEVIAAVVRIEPLHDGFEFRGERFHSSGRGAKQIPAAESNLGL